MSALYRIISFPEFVNLVVKRTERYRQPMAWEDTYEAFMLQLLSDDTNTQKILESIFSNLSQNIELTTKNYFKLWIARWGSYGQCWTKTAETDAMWRIYSYDRKAIRIETNEDTIKNMIDASELNSDYTVYIDDVYYDLDETMDLASQMALLRCTKRVIEPFFHKRTAFQHEDEKRVILLNKSMQNNYVEVLNQLAKYNISYECNKCDIHPTSDLKKVFKIVEEQVRNIRIFKDNKSVPENIFLKNVDLPQYIKSVMVHPQAEDWIVDLVEEICLKNGINFIGKSKMYGKLV